jgi:DNA ligase-1
MLAHKYIGWQGPCYSQPKLDGMRCLANKIGLWSRGNRRIVAAPHIEQELKKIFDHHPNLILDGELYNHDMHDDFNGIMSIVKRTIIGQEEIERSKKFVQYHIYDEYDIINPHAIFRDRNFFLGDTFLDYNLPSCFVVDTLYCAEETLLNWHYSQLLLKNYEGQIIRFDKPYEQKRSNYLLKRKEFIDEEFELIEIKSGEGNYEGYAKIAECKTADGKVFGAGIKGAKDYTKELLGKKFQSVTIRYQNLSPDGIPRFPVAIAFNDGKIENRKPNKQKDFF